MKKIFALLLCALPCTLLAQDYTLHLKSGDVITETGKIQGVNRNAEVVNGHYYRFIQFYKIPGNQQKKELQKLGVTLHNYVTGRTFIASIPVHLNLSILNNEGIRAIFPIESKHKLDKNLAKKIYPDHAMVGSKIKLIATHQPDVPTTEVSSMLTKAGVEVLEKISATDVYVIAIPVSRIDEIAALPYIAFLEVVEPEATPDNLDGVTNHRSNFINTEYRTGLKYDGTGISICLNDDGVIGPHIDYTGRLMAQYMTYNGGDHGDHCAGTIFGAGNLNPIARGMAPGAELYVYRATGTYQGFDSLASHYVSKNIRITSSSYSNGTNAGYTNFARRMDIHTRQMPELMHVFSSGNEGTENTGPAGPNWANVTGGHKQAKNVIAVGNLTAVDGLNTSSSRGPAEDGRIKPDICAVGTSVYSTIDDNKYENKTGTSMSCPGVAGITAQLYHAYKDMNSGAYPYSALIKGVMLNTADDLGNPGPDFKHGWGRINARRAYNVLQQQQYITDNISDGNNNTHQLTVPANTAELRVMVYWNDYEAASGVSKALVNDIDMNITTPSSTTVLPWKLDHTLDNTLLDLPAIQAVDHLNNMEQVTIPNPAAGVYTVNINGYEIAQGPQRYHVIYEFVKDEVVLTYPTGGESFTAGTNELIRWDAYDNTGTFALQYTTDDGANWTDINTNIAGTARQYTWMPPANVVTGQARMRISRNATSDESDQNFSIINVATGLQVDWECLDSIKVRYNAVTGATGYIISVLGAKYMDSVAFSTTTSCVVRGLNNTNGGWYSVQAVSDNNCKGRRAIAKQYLAAPACSPLSVHEVSNGWDAEIYPNPVEDKFQVKLNGIEEEVNITVADVKGKLVHQQVLAPGISNVTIDMKDSPAGIYFISVAGKQGVIKKKLVKL